MQTTPCPVCGKPFTPWGAWRITPWTSIGCPHCRARLTAERGAGIQVVSVLIVFGGGVLLNAIPTWGHRVPILAELFVIAWLVDAATIRLKPVSALPLAAKD